jgi:hypothetical protein
MIGQIRRIECDVRLVIVEPEGQVDLLGRSQIGGLPQHLAALPVISGSSSVTLRRTIGLPSMRPP